MANTKEIQITGTAPFCLYEDEKLQPQLAFLAGPTTGIKLKWTGGAGYVPNEHGGKTAMYNFLLEGAEAVSYPWIDAFKESIKRIGGKIHADYVYDLDAG